jgi:hypothetical protein
MMKKSGPVKQLRFRQEIRRPASYALKLSRSLPAADPDLGSGQQLKISS